jgi:two-component system response regulator DesR
LITVLVADPHRLFAEALAVALEAPDLEVMDEHPRTGLDLVKAALERHPDVIVADFWMEGMQGTVATRFILRRVPRTKFILLSWFHTPRDAQEAIDSGASSFIPKSAEVSRVHDEILRVHTQDSADEVAEEPPALKRRRAGPAGWEQILSLTLREVEILSALALHSTEDTAEMLGMSLGTLRNQILSIRSKTGARTKLEAVELARAYGVI